MDTPSGSVVKGKFVIPDITCAPPAFNKNLEGLGQGKGKSGEDDNAFALEVIRDGSVVGKQPLIGEGKSDKERGCILIGRDEEVCDVLLGHESISRNHAVILFARGPSETKAETKIMAKTDTETETETETDFESQSARSRKCQDLHLLLVDIGSTHGTKLNRKEIEKKKFHEVKVGDVIQFGASRSTFVIMGPEEMTREETYDPGRTMDRTHREYQHPHEQHNTKGEGKGEGKGASIANDSKHPEDNSVSWGIGIDIDTEDDDTDIDIGRNKKREDEEGNDSGILGKGARTVSEGESEISFGGTQNDLPEYIAKARENQSAVARKALARDRPAQTDFTGEGENDGSAQQQRKLFEQMEKRKTKAMNLQQEIERIRAKAPTSETGELTQGQQHQIEKNERQLEKLQGEMDDLEDEIHQATGTTMPRNKSQKKRGRTTESTVVDLADEDADDVFFDRTKKSQRSSNEPSEYIGTQQQQQQRNEPLTTAMIEEKMAKLKDHLDEAERELARTTRAHQSVMDAQSKAEADSEPDTLDIYLKQSESRLAKEEKEKAETRVAELKKELQKMRKLWKLSLPAIPAGSAASTTKSKLQPPSTINVQTTPVESHEKATSGSAMVAGKQQVPDDEKQTQSQIPKQAPISVQSKDKKATHVSAKAQMPKSSSGIKNSKFKGPQLVPSHQNVVQKHVSTPVFEEEKEEENEDEEDEDEDVDDWIPPFGQNGDGRTWLNDKYGY